MSRLGIEMKDVFIACDKLAAQEIKPTIDRVRQMIGNTGSNTTISKYLRLWEPSNNEKNKKTNDYYRGYRDAIRKMNNLLRTI